MDNTAQNLIGLVLLTMSTGTPAVINVNNPAHIRVHSLHVEGELGRDRVFSVTRDSHGYLWMGSDNGLKRYDGYSIDTFNHDPHDPDSLGTTDNVPAVLVDSKGTLWIGGGVLSKYNPEYENFTNYGETDAGGIETMAETPGGMLWLGGQGFGLIGFDTGKRRIAYRIPSPDANERPWKIQDLENDPKDPYVLWIASYSGVFRLDTRSLTLKPVFTSNKLGGSDSQLVQDLMIDDKGRLWLASETGLYVVTPKTGETRHYQRQSGNPNSLVTNILTGVYQDSTGRIWIGTDKLGVHIYRPETDDFAYLPASSTDPMSFYPAGVRNIYEDMNGSLWFCLETYGVQRVTPHLEKFYTIPPGTGNKKLSFDSLLDLLEDREGHIWIATDGGGLNRYDPETGIIDKYFHDPDDPDSLSSNTVLSLEEDDNGMIWIGTWTGGLNRLNPETGRFTHFKHDPNVPRNATVGNNNIFRVVKGKDGWLWLSNWDKGLQRFHPESGKFITFEYNNPKDTSGLLNGSVNAIIPAGDGRFWIGGYSGLEIYNPVEQTFQQIPLGGEPLPPGGEQTAIFDLYKDDRGILWIATTRGLLSYNPVTSTVKRYMPDDGLPDLFVTSILRDGSGNFWLGTRGGLVRFSPETETFETFNKKDGLASTQFNRYSRLKGRDGVMYFGGPKGLTIFDPENIPRNTKAPNTVITGFELFQKPVTPQTTPFLDNTVRYTEKLVLPYSQRDVTFEFSSLSFISPTQNRYRYRLKGLEENWTEVDSNRRRARYTNLYPGEYRFQVTGSNNEGIWSKQVESIGIRVLAPWWMTWWARTLMVLSGLGAVYAFIAWRLKLNRRREKELSKEIEERRSAEAKLFKIAYHDALTGLPNRLSLTERLTGLIRRSHNEDSRPFALLFIDGDRFKKVNDTHGHQLGDRLLIAAADRLNRLLPKKYHGIRLGGDEFTILVEDFESEDDVIKIAETVITEFNKPFRVDQNLLFFKVSIGVVFCDKQYSYPGHILRDADIAMYKAKELGKGTFQIFDAAMREQTLEATELEADLYTALAQDQLHLMYQPVINLKTGELNGFEALVRWNHPVKGPIPPDKFIPVAEESGLIVTMGTWVLRQACTQLAAWIEEFQLKNPPTMSVNLSSLEFSQQNFLSRLDKTLTLTGLDGRLLKLEITETTLMEHNDAMNSLLEALRQRNIQLAIDDFGTGYSSLRYLDQLPVQVLKIDKSFTDGIGFTNARNSGSVEIVRATISLAHNLKIMVTAEGIETEEQYHLLKAWGCDFGQGYHIAKPLTSDDAARFMHQEPVPQSTVYVATAGMLAEGYHRPAGSRRRYRDK